jgi:hypothetical protein
VIRPRPEEQPPQPDLISSSRVMIAQPDDDRGAAFQNDLSASDAQAFLSIGHEPVDALSERERRLLNAFESNLVSLLTHELKTPFLGVMNGLALVELEFETNENLRAIEKTIGWAHLKRGVERLNQTFSSLNDLLSIHSGQLRLELFEVNLARALEELARGLIFQNALPSDSEVRVLLDTKRFRLAFTNALGAFESRLGVARSQLGLRLALIGSDIEMILSTPLKMISDEGKSAWLAEWKEFLVAAKSGVYSPGSAFSGNLLSENFLTRDDSQKLTSDWVITDAVVRAHQGVLEEYITQDELGVRFRLPCLNSLAGFRLLLESRLQRSNFDWVRSTRLAFCVADSVDPQSMESVIRESLSSRFNFEQPICISMSDLGCAVFLSFVQLREGQAAIFDPAAGAVLPAGYRWVWVDPSCPVDSLIHEHFSKARQ